MNKCLFASMAVLCTILSSCSTQEYDFIEPKEIQSETIEEHHVSTRSANSITVSFTDINGASQSFACDETRLTYISRTRIEIFIKYADGTTQTELGNDIDIVPDSGNILITLDSSSTITSTDLEVDACMPECCYTYNNGNNTGTALSFIVEEETGGF